ncbi:xylose isomerase [Artemisia annua]|uniref:Xylose isomerase n=1 Tax=Artemisia annua TaxID=35608 RepID=A0A2U1N7X3_ARTAN|nr:xylose isomerase [Artemisia annua]
MYKGLTQLANDLTFFTDIFIILYTKRQSKTAFKEVVLQNHYGTNLLSHWLFGCNLFLMSHFSAHEWIKNVGFVYNSGKWEGEFFLGIPKIKYEDWMRFIVAFCHTFRGKRGIQKEVTRSSPTVTGNYLRTTDRPPKMAFVSLSGIWELKACRRDKEVSSNELMQSDSDAVSTARTTVAHMQLEKSDNFCRQLLNPTGTTNASKGAAIAAA